MTKIEFDLSTIIGQYADPVTIKGMPPRAPFIHLYREAMHLQCFTPMRYVGRRGHVYVTTFTQIAQNYNVGSLLALYGSP